MPLKVIVSGLLVVAGLMTAPLAVSAADRSTPEQTKALAEKAATYLKDKGPDAALPAFNDRNGSFVHGDLYVFVFDMNGKYLASGANPTLTGTNAKDLNSPLRYIP